MVNQPAYLANLKAYGRARWKDDAEAIATAREITNNESDRGAIILVSTNVEDMLEYKILERLPALLEDEPARKAMFELDGPIASFSRKLHMAYAMGIVNKHYRKQIDLVREIRNACAHSRLPVALEVPAIADAVRHLIADTYEHLVDRSPKALRNAFVIKCMMLSNYISSGEEADGFDAILRAYRKHGGYLPDPSQPK